MTPKTMFALLTLTAATALAQTPPPPAPGAATAPDGPHVKTKTRDVQYRVERFGGPGGPGWPGGADGGFHGARIAPPGMWWKNPELVQKISLSADQQKKMDDIFQQSRIQLIDLKANVEKQEVLLEPMLSANPPDTNKVLAQIDHVAGARAELEKANARMLLGIRGVLTADQWTKLQAEERDNRHILFKGPGDGPGFIIKRGPEGRGPGGPGPESLLRQLPLGPMGLVGPGMGFSTQGGTIGLFNQLPQTTFQMEQPMQDFEFSLPEDGLDIDI